MYARGLLRKVLSLLLLNVFFFSVNTQYLFAATETAAVSFDLPAANALVSLSDSFELPQLKGIKYDPANPYDLQFIMDQGDAVQIEDEQKDKLVRLFLAALTIPEDKLWVNLSPYEEDRIIDDSVAKTEIGEVLLNQDYILKQLSSSLTNPDNELGKAYWANTDVDGLNKIWISPQEIDIYDDLNTVFIDKITMNVQTEADYLAAKEINANVANRSSEIVRDLIVPEIREDVNKGRNFAELRQMISSVVLAQWFKHKFANSLYTFYFNAEKLSGLDLVGAKIKEKVFERYVDAFNSGAYNVVKKVKDPQTGRLLKKAYFSGGIQSSAIEEMDINHLKLSQIGDNKKYELSTVEIAFEQSSSLSTEEIEQIKKSAIAALEKKDYTAFEEEFLKLHRSILATKKHQHPRMDILAASLELKSLAPNYVDRVVERHEQAGARKPLKIQSWDDYLYALYTDLGADFNQSSSVKSLFIASLVLATVSMPLFIMNIVGEDKIHQTSEQTYTAVEFNKVLYDQTLTHYLEMKSYSSLLNALRYKLSGDEAGLSLSTVRQGLDSLDNYLASEYFNHKSLPQPLIEARRDEIKNILSFLNEYQYRFGGYIEGADKELYNAAIEKLLIYPSNKYLIDAMEIIESIQLANGNSIEEIKSTNNLNDILKLILQDIQQILDSEDNSLIKQYYNLKEARDFIEAYARESRDKAGSSILAEQYKDIDAINAAAVRASRLYNKSRFIKEYLKLYDIIDPVEKEYRYQEIRRYALNKMSELYDQHRYYTEESIRVRDEILNKRSEEQRKEIIRQLDGGINLDGIYDSIKTQSTSSSITISPEYAKVITGLKFEFVGRTQIMPLKALLQN